MAKPLSIIVTGSEGFIGKHVVEMLQGQHLVLGLDCKNGYSLEDPETYDRINFTPDIIIHLAARCSTSASIRDPIGDFYDNAVATVRLLEYAREKGAKFIYTSSCKAQDNETGILTPYGASKRVGELYVNEYQKLYGLETIINRPGTVYGPGQEGSSESGWIAWFQKADKVQVFGSGRQVRDLLYVTDYAELIREQVEHFDLYKNGTYNVGGGVANAVSVMGMVYHMNLDYEYAPARPGDAMRYVADNKVPGKWKPLISWRDKL